MDTPAKVRAIAEVVGAVTVVLSLVFVGLETHQNTVAMRAATAEDLFASSREYIANVLANRPLMELYVTVQKDPSVVDSLPGTVEGMMLDLLYQDRFNALDNAYYHFRHGTLDAGMWTAWKSWLETMADDPVLRYYWTRIRASTSPEFREFMDTNVLK